MSAIPEIYEDKVEMMEVKARRIGEHIDHLSFVIGTSYERRVAPTKNRYDFIQCRTLLGQGTSDAEMKIVSEYIRSQGIMPNFHAGKWLYYEWSVFAP